MSSKKPLFAFFGTPHLSVCVLDRLEASGFLPALVVTAPDRPSGRGLALTPSPVREWATERGIDVLTPETLSDQDFLAELSNTDWDVFIVAMYAKLIPKTILDLPQHGTLNVHPSLLPKFRGPSPVLSAILADLPAQTGERATGVSIMLLTEGMDEGPVIAQAKIELEEGGEDGPGRQDGGWPPKGSVFEELLATEGGNLLAESMPFWLRGELPAEPQDNTQATYTKKFTTQDALIDLAGNARENYLKIRAFDQSPRAHFFAERGEKKVRVIVTDAQIVEGKLEILKVIPEGKKEMDYSVFMAGSGTRAQNL
ncbi:MAG: methionyl-tRNA formyltransferase [bacterium]